MRRQRSGVVIYIIYDNANFIPIKLLSFYHYCYAGSSAMVNAGREREKGHIYYYFIHFIIIVMQSFYYYCYAVNAGREEERSHIYYYFIAVIYFLCSHFIIIVMQ